MTVLYLNTGHYSQLTFEYIEFSPKPVVDGSADVIWCLREYFSYIPWEFALDPDTITVELVNPSVSEGV